MGLYGAMGGEPRESTLEWRWPNGVSFRYAHLEHEKNVFAYQGSQIPLIMIDEATHFSAGMFWYLLSRNRSMCGVRPYVRLTCNPDPDSFLAEMVDWYLTEDGTPDPAKDGRVRYFVRRDGQCIWSESVKELTTRLKCDPLDVKSFAFISATVYDNPALLKANPEYVANLKALDPIQRARLLEGNWKIRYSGEWFKNPQFLPWPSVPCIGWVDPAYSGKNTTAFAIACRSEGRIHLRGWTWRKSITDLYAEIAAIAHTYMVGSITVESNADKGMSAQAMTEFHPAIEQHTERENKHARIIGNLYRNWEAVRIAEDCQPDFLSQIMGYQEGKEPDDAPDAAAGVLRKLSVQGNFTGRKVGTAW